MRKCRIGVTLDQSILKKLDRLVRQRCFPSRGAAIREAIQEKVQRVSRRRLARECTKLDPFEEQRLAEVGFAKDVRDWPEY
jgi:metal-responsive CopG/Arc/MetJ family transcriptional regulator